MLRGLDDVGGPPLLLELRYGVVLGEYRERGRRPQLGRLGDEILISTALDRRNGEPDIGDPCQGVALRLRTHAAALRATLPITARRSPHRTSRAIPQRPGA